MLLRCWRHVNVALLSCVLFNVVKLPLLWYNIMAGFSSRYFNIFAGVVDIVRTLSWVGRITPGWCMRWVWQKGNTQLPPLSPYSHIVHHILISCISYSNVSRMLVIYIWHLDVIKQFWNSTTVPIWTCTAQYHVQRRRCQRNVRRARPAVQRDSKAGGEHHVSPSTGPQPLRCQDQVRQSLQEWHGQSLLQCCCCCLSTEAFYC